MAGGGKLPAILSAAAVAVLAAVIFAAVDFNLTWKIPPLWRRKIAAELVVMNATIYTSDSSLPFAEAMAVCSGRIVRVGDFSSMKDLVSDETNILDVEGKIVMSGFIDSHVHLIFGGLQMARVGLRNVRSLREFVRTVKEAVEGKFAGEWVLGGGWNNDLWGGDLPVASWIDDITSNNPVWLSRMDGHMGLANALAMQIAGITSSMNDPIGGTIMRNADGEPTGLLVDSAMKLVLRVIPEVSLDEKRDALLNASSLALSRGITTVVDFGRYFPGASVDHVWEDLTGVYGWADSSGKMLIRVCLFFPMQTLSRLVDLVREKGRTLSQWIYLGGVKAFADGSIGSNSALLYEPYEDDSTNYGLQVTDMDWLFNATLSSDNSSIQVAIHAIGDKANDLVLHMFDTVASLNGIRDRRFRIEHAQHLLPQSTGLFSRQKVIASVQPDHLLYDADTAEKKLGALRARTGSYLFQSLLTADAQIAFGSDWPVADMNPLGSIKTAVRRIPPGRDTAWIPKERIALTDALDAYTISAAQACFLDHELGSLSAGKYADFVVLSASWTEFAVGVHAAVVSTYVGGLQVYP